MQRAALRVRLDVVDGREARVDRGPVHVLRRPVRPGVHVAMPARHVAQLADVDLEDLQRRRREALLPAARHEVAVEAARPARPEVQGHGVERSDLRGGLRQRRAAGVQARGPLRAVHHVGQEFGREDGEGDRGAVAVGHRGKGRV